MNSNIHISAFRTMYNDTISSRDIPSDTSRYKFSSYMQISQTFGFIVLTAGIRSDYFSMIDEPFAVAPRFSISARILPDTKLNTSFGRYYQSPSYIWLMGNSFNQTLIYMGMNQYVLGVEHYIRSDLSVSLEGYVKQYDHYPVSLTRPYIVMVNADPAIESIEDAYTSFGLDYMQSSGTGESRGVELFLLKRISDTPLYGRMSITYSDTRFTALDGISRPSSFDQRWKMTVSGGYALNEKWEFNATFHLATGRPYTPFGIKNGVPYFYVSRDTYNSARVGTNHGLDLRVSRRWVVGSIVINTFVDIQNVYNRKPEEPPQWNLSTMLPETTPTLGIVPSIGVAVEF